MSYAQVVSGKRIVYGGYRMRSRLETQLAVTLDALGIQWRYEVDRIALPNGSAYLPDFTVLADPAEAVGARWIEVKDKQVVSRCAETLGVGYRTQRELASSYAWSPPRPLGDVFSLRDEWQVLRKPILAAWAQQERVLIYGNTSHNAAVLMLLPDGTVQARRRHVLHAAGTATRVDLLEEMQQSALGAADHDARLAIEAAHSAALSEHWERRREEAQARREWASRHFGDADWSPWSA